MASPQQVKKGRVVELDECHDDDMEAMLCRWWFVEILNWNNFRTIVGGHQVM